MTNFIELATRCEAAAGTSPCLFWSQTNEPFTLPVLRRSSGCSSRCRMSQQGLFQSAGHARQGGQRR